MWYTTRYEGFDDPKHSKRGPAGFYTLQGVFSGLLRTGILLEIIGITGLLISYYVYEGTELFTYDLRFTTEEQRQQFGFRLCLGIFTGIYLIGGLKILFFQTLLADDASSTRGYRAGAKFLGNAAFFDVVSSTIQLIIFIYMGTKYDKVWWKQFSSGGVEWLFSSLCRLLHAFALIYYACSLFLLEVYHDQGTNDWHGVLNCFFFTATGIIEIAVLMTGNPAIPVALNWISLMSALIWAMAFEQEVNATGPLLNESELTNEIESQVEKFARISPYLNQ